MSIKRLLLIIGLSVCSLNLMYSQSLNRIVLSQNSINTAIASNSICEVTSRIDLKGQKLKLPKNCVLDVSKGQITNGTIVGNNTTVYASPLSLYGIRVEGSFASELMIDYFISSWDKTVDCSGVINMLFSVQNIVHLPDHDIVVRKPIQMKTGKTLTGTTQLGSSIITYDNNAIEIPEKSRYIEISNLTLRNTNRDKQYYPSNKTSGIECVGTQAGVQIKLIDLTINSYHYGVHMTDVFWSSQVARCRFNFCDIGFWGEQRGVGSSIVNSFRDCYFNECKDYGLSVSGYNEVLIESCNFGGILLSDERNVSGGQRAMCRLTNCKLATIRSCNFELMTLNDYNAAVICSSSSATIMNSTFANLHSQYTKGGAKKKTLSASILANNGSNVEIVGYRSVNNKELNIDVLSYQNSSVIIDSDLISSKTLSGGSVGLKGK